ncbi:hypothetical protein E3N88_03507 [Mikania micrantha]|uniref:Uncharacterized protein n=1 Tax=Mikania micrantha TaxID=192012 RepID=A0A5N6Q912_9ASTR|nr:hypothetical protein E3N88_03507 [Mikania micrantha]
MAASVISVTSFVLVICMHISHARLLPPAIVSPPSSTAKPHHYFSTSLLQDSRKRSQIEPHASSSSSKGEYGEGNASHSKIDQVFKEGSEIVESSSSHDHVALLNRKPVKDTETPQYFRKEAIVDPKNEDIEVTDYQPPRRKTPIHNK